MSATSKPTLYMFCGKISAGKSTFARQLAEASSAILISEDDWTSSLFKEELKTIDDYSEYSQRLRNVMGPHVVSILKHGLSVVLDFPANTARFRKWMRSIIEEASCGHELHYFNVSDEICKARLRMRNASGAHHFEVNEEEFDLFTSYFEPPEHHEDFIVITHRPGS